MLSALLVVGCVTPPQVVVHVTSDEVSSARAAFLTFEVYAADSDVPRYARTVSVGAAGEIPALGAAPARLTVVPRDSDPSRRFLVVATLSDASRNVFSQRRAISTFIDGALSEIWLHFDDACADLLGCDGTSTCDASSGEASCAPACVVPSPPGSVVRSEVQACGDDCAFGADGDGCGDEGAAGRCWGGACCRSCFDGTRCLDEDELSLAAYGVEGAECVSCDCPGDAMNPEGGCLPAFETRGLTGASAHACVSFDGTLHCWGNNEAGQVGTGATSSFVGEPTPVLAAGTAKALGDAHSCALVDGDRTTCWGDGERYQLGQDDTTSELEPGALTVLEGPFSLMSAGQWHSCGVTPEGVFCWGANSDGECGQDMSIFRVRTPTRVLAGRVTSIDSGRRTTCAVVDARLHCWGFNDSGAVGLPSSQMRVDAAVDVSGELEDTWRTISVSAFGACGLSTEDRLFCRGQVRTDITSDFDIEREDEEHLLFAIGQERWRQAHLGEHHLCGIRRDDTLLCLGQNDRGQLGGEGARRVEPGPLGLRWRAVVAGDSFTCAMRQDETIWCWGDNESRQLGSYEASDEHADGAIFSATPRRLCPPVAGP